MLFHILTLLAIGGNRLQGALRLLLPMGMAIVMEQDRENDACLQDDIIDEEGFEFVLFTLSPLHSVFLRRSSVFYTTASAFSISASVIRLVVMMWYVCVA